MHGVDRNLFICIFSQWAPKSVKVRYRNVGNCKMHVITSISLFTPKAFIPCHLLELINDGESLFGGQVMRKWNRTTGRYQNKTYSLALPTFKHARSTVQDLRLIVESTRCTCMGHWKRSYMRRCSRLIPQKNIAAFLSEENTFMLPQA